MKFNGPRISIFKRWLLRFALKLGFKKPDDVYVSVSNYHKQLMQLGHKELITRIVYLASQLYNVREAIPVEVYNKFIEMPKRKLVRVVIDMSAAIQRYGKIVPSGIDDKNHDGEIHEKK